MTIRIKCDSIDPYNGEITTSTGEPIRGVSRVELTMAAGEINRAEISVIVSEVDVEAHPLLCFDTVEQAAAVYGYRLEKI